MERRRGRPRSFDKSEALDAAMDLFWARGFDAASMDELTTAMGIRSPSIYAAFGGKAALFLQSLDHYQSTLGGYVARSLAREPTRLAIETLLLECVRHFTRTDRPSGCLVVLSSLSIDAVTYPALAVTLGRYRKGLEEAVAARLALGRDAGDIAPDTDVAALARLVVVLFEGLAVAARQGARRDELEASARLALVGLPMEDPAEDTASCRQATATLGDGPPDPTAILAQEP